MFLSEKDVAPYKRLAQAIIDEAFSDLLGKAWTRASNRSFAAVPSRTRQNAAISAWNWINEQSDHAFGFQFCCGLLNLNPEAVREKIKWQYRTTTGTFRPRR